MKKYSHQESISAPSVRRKHRLELHSRMQLASFTQLDMREEKIDIILQRASHRADARDE